MTKPKARFTPAQITTMLRAKFLLRQRGWGWAACVSPAGGPLLPHNAEALHSGIAVLGPDDAMPEHDKRYVDRLKLVARGGGGGHGCVSFWRSVSRGGHQARSGLRARVLRFHPFPEKLTD